MRLLKKHIVTYNVKEDKTAREAGGHVRKLLKAGKTFVVDNLIYLMKASYIVLIEGLTIMVSQLLAMPHCNSKLAANTQNYFG